MAELEWKGKTPAASTAWDGLTSYYERLWEIAQPTLPQIVGWTDLNVARETAYHEHWLQALRAASVDDAVVR